VIDPVGEHIIAPTLDWTLRGSAYLGHQLAYDIHSESSTSYTIEDSVKGVDTVKGCLQTGGSWVHGKVHSGIHTLTGSEVYADLTTDIALMVLTEGAFRYLPKASMKVWDLSKSSCNYFGRYEFYIDTYRLGANGGNVGFRLKPQVEVPTPAPTAPKVAEARVSEAPLGLTTAAERVQNNPMLMKHYKYHMEKITELKLHPAQTEKLKEVLRTTNFEKLSKEEYSLHTQEYYRLYKKMIKEWEANTGQKWPVYEKDYFSPSGTLQRKKGQSYDAHHIIQRTHRGPNEWWNIHPAHGLEHHPKIHGKGAPARTIFTEPTK
jgi:hypothetical protein